MMKETNNITNPSRVTLTTTLEVKNTPEQEKSTMKMRHKCIAKHIFYPCLQYKIKASSISQHNDYMTYIW